MTEQRPTFREARKQHHITLNMLIEDAQIDPSAVLLLDTWAIGEAGIVSRLLESLSRLSGREYHRDLLTLELYVFGVFPYVQVDDEVAEESQWRGEGGRSEQDKPTR